MLVWNLIVLHPYMFLSLSLVAIVPTGIDDADVAHFRRREPSIAHLLHPLVGSLRGAIDSTTVRIHRIGRLRRVPLVGDGVTAVGGSSEAAHRPHARAPFVQLGRGDHAAAPAHWHAGARLPLAPPLQSIGCHHRRARAAQPARRLGLP